MFNWLIKRIRTKRSQKAQIQRRREAMIRRASNNPPEPEIYEWLRVNEPETGIATRHAISLIEDAERQNALRMASDSDRTAVHSPVTHTSSQSHGHSHSHSHHSPDSGSHDSGSYDSGSYDSSSSGSDW